MIPTPTRTESDVTRGITAEQNIRGFRRMSAAMSACRNAKLCPCLLALDCWRITSKPHLGRFRQALLTIPPTIPSAQFASHRSSSYVGAVRQDAGDDSGVTQSWRKYSSSRLTGCTPTCLRQKSSSESL